MITSAGARGDAPIDFAYVSDGAPADSAALMLAPADIAVYISREDADGVFIIKME